MMKKQSIILLISCLLALHGSAQRKMQQLDEEEAKKQEQLKAYEKKDRKFDPEKLVYGGNLGGAISNNGSYFLLQPMVGYRVLEKTIPGLGFNYTYQSVKYNTGQTLSSSNYGPIVFLRQGLFGNVFAHAEWSPMNYQLYSSFTKSERIWVNQAFIGGGFGGDGVQVYVLYNLLQDQSPFEGSPWYLRIGFLF